MSFFHDLEEHPFNDKNGQETQAPCTLTIKNTSKCDKALTKTVRLAMVLLSISSFEILLIAERAVFFQPGVTRSPAHSKEITRTAE